jgi:hypothetical protein
MRWATVLPPLSARSLVCRTNIARRALLSRLFSARRCCALARSSANLLLTASPSPPRPDIVILPGISLTVLEEDPEDAWGALSISEVDVADPPPWLAGGGGGA